MAIDTFVVFVGVYGNVDDAEADYQAVHDLHVEFGLLDAYDAAVINRREDGKVKIVKFDDVFLKEFVRLSRDVVAEAGAGDALSRRVYASYQQFRASIMDWSDIAERAFLNARRLV